MICEVCEAPIRPEARYCPNCGMPVSYNTPPSSAKLPAIASTAESSSPSNQPPAPFQPSMPTSSPIAPPSPSLPEQPTKPAPFFDESGQLVFNGTVPSAPSPLPTHVAAPVPQPPTRRSSRGRIFIVLLVILLLALVGELGYYFLVVQPTGNRTSLTGTPTPGAATVQAEATDIATAPSTLFSRVTAGKPAIQDMLNSSSANAWTAYSGNNGRCAFTGGLYHINSLSAGLTDCFFRARNFDDFAFQVQMTITKGDAGGISFRFPSPGTTASSLNAYIFIVNVLGQSSLIRIHNGDYTPLVTKSSPVISKGVNQATLLTVIARGNTFFLYVNRLFITSVQDKTFSTGLVGLLSLSFQDPTEVAFHNAQIWA